MIKVEWTEQNLSITHECVDLNNAMELSKELKDKSNITARIIYNNMEIIGEMGADIVNNGILPSGEPYTWYKRRTTKDTKFKGRKR